MSPGAKLTVVMGIAVGAFFAGRWVLRRVFGEAPAPSEHQSEGGAPDGANDGDDPGDSD